MHARMKNLFDACTSGSLEKGQMSGWIKRNYVPVRTGHMKSAKPFIIVILSLPVYPGNLTDRVATVMKSFGLHLRRQPHSPKD